MKPPVRLRNVKNKKKSNSTATPLLKKNLISRNRMLTTRNKIT